MSLLEEFLLIMGAFGIPHGFYLDPTQKQQVKPFCADSLEITHRDFPRNNSLTEGFPSLGYKANYNQSYKL